MIQKGRFNTPGYRKHYMAVLSKSTLLFYEKLVGDLEAYGFRINPYDMCVANKMIGRKQLTVFWHVDDLKISCVDANEVPKMIQWLE